MNLYIESLEGGNYLVSTGDNSDQVLLRDSNERPKVFHCLNEIREHFNQRSFDKVWLRQTTPYEEMVGQNDDPGPLELELDWH